MSKLQLFAGVISLLLLGVAIATLACRRNGSWTKTYRITIQIAHPQGTNLTSAQIAHGADLGGNPLSLYSWREPAGIAGNLIHCEIMESGTTMVCGLITTDINRPTYTVIRAHFDDGSWGAYRVYNPDVLATGEISIDPSDAKYKLPVDPAHYQNLR